MDILTKNPEVWKKTIFILCYDENDGYFDHVPPFVPPNPDKSESGATSKGVDTSVEFVTLEQDLKRRPPSEARGSSIGLGYRVPLVVASPWSRGGFVNSQVFDHTSILQFLEKFVRHKTGKQIEEPNISAWRRTVCGDITSAFRPYDGERIAMPEFLEKDEVIENIHKSKFKDNPAGFSALTTQEIEQLRQSLRHPLMPRQEKGIRPSCALPYQLYADGKLSDERQSFLIQFQASNKSFGAKSAGSPFHVYANNHKDPRAYAVSAGDRLTDAWPISDFSNSLYTIRVYGPNGFFREFLGNNNDPLLDVHCEYERNGTITSGNITLAILNKMKNPVTVRIKSENYNRVSLLKNIPAAKNVTINLNLKESHNWYDFSISVDGYDTFKQRYAGRVETGKDGFSDPLIAGI
jgi:phospholipase C